MGDNPKPTTSASNAPIFITQEQFEASQKALINAQTEAFKSAQQEMLAKLTEQLKIVIPPTPVTPSAPTAPSGTQAKTREQEFEEGNKLVADWFAKTKISPKATESGTINWSVPSDIILKRMGYNFDADISNSKKATEDVTYNTADKMTRYVRKFIFLKGGRFVTPVRQYCDFLPLEDGYVAQWYTFDAGYDFGAITEGSVPTPVTSTIAKVQATPAVRGGLQYVNYSDIETAPAPLVDAINQMAVVAGLKDESVDLLNTVVGSTTGSAATNHWVEGDDGAVITADTTFGSSHTLKVAGVLAAKKQIIRSLGDPAAVSGNLVLFVGTQAYTDLLLDVVSYTKYTSAAEITQGVVEQVVGAEIVQTDNLKRDPTTNHYERNILAVRGLAFGMTSGRDISMEASRRNEKQQVFLTATQRVKAQILDNEAYALISSYLAA